MSEQFFNGKTQEFISSRDAARLFGVTHDYISRLCRKGSLTGVLDGRKWLVEKTSLESFFALQGTKQKFAVAKSEEYLTSKEAARMYRVTNDYIARLCKQGKLSGVLKDRTWMVEQGSLAAFFVSRTAYTGSAKNNSAEMQVYQLPALAPQKEFISVPARSTPTYKYAIAALVGVLLLGTSAFGMSRASVGNGQLASAWSGFMSAVGGLHDLFFGNGYNPQPVLQTAVQPVPAPVAAVSQPTATTTLQTIIEQKTYPITERTVEQVVTQTGLSESDIDTKIQEAGNKLRSDLSAQFNSTPAPYSSGGFTNNLALSQRIDQLSDVTITNATVHGVSGLTVADIPPLNYLSTSGTLAALNGGTGTSTAPAYGQLLVGNSAGGYDLIATSSLGIIGGTGFATGTVSVANGGTGSTTLAGILVGAGTSPVASLLVGSGLTFDGTTLAASGSGGGLASTSLSAVYPLAYNSSTDVFTTAFSTTTTNTFSQLQTFTTGLFATNASTTNATTTSFAITNISGQLLKTLSDGAVVAAVAGTDYLTSANVFAYLFPNNATTTPIAFNGGLSGNLTGNVSGNAGTVTNGVYTTTFNGLFDPRFVSELTATTSVNSIITLNNLSLPFLQLSGVPAFDTFVFPFTPTTAFGSAANATSTLIGFTGGLYSTASSTFTSNINVGGQAIFGSTVGIGTTSPYAALSVFGTTTSTGGFDVDGSTNLLSYLGSTSISVGGIRNFFAGLGANGSTTKANGTDNIAIGSQAGFAVTGNQNVYIGSQSGVGSTTGAANSGNTNTAVGYKTLAFNSLGTSNSAFGANALGGNTVGSFNDAFGSSALSNNKTGIDNVSIGDFSNAFSAPVKTVSVGFDAGGAGGSALGFTAIGYKSGFNNTTGADFNTFLGYQSGINVTSGYGNLLIGVEDSNSGFGGNLTTGSGNIGIGYNLFFPNAVGNNQLNIGGLLFGTIPATTTGFLLPTSGALGVGTSSPFAKFAIQTNNGDTSTTLFAIGSSTASATTTLFSISNTGSTTIANGINITSGCYAIGGTCLTTGSSGSTFAFPWTPTTVFGSAANATSTLIGFTGGLYSTASSTFTSNFNVGGQAVFGNKVGIGTNAPSSKLSVTDSSTAASGNVSSILLASTYAPSAGAFTTNMNSLDISSTLNTSNNSQTGASGTVGYLRSLYADSIVSGSGNVNSVYGGTIETELSGSASTTFAYGNHSLIVNDGTGHLQDGFTNFSELFQTSGTASTTYNYYGDAGISGGLADTLITLGNSDQSAAIAAGNLGAQYGAVLFGNSRFGNNFALPKDTVEVVGNENLFSKNASTSLKFNSNVALRDLQDGYLRVNDTAAFFNGVNFGSSTITSAAAASFATSGGNVGIGTTSPTQGKLTVTGSGAGAVLIGDIGFGSNYSTLTLNGLGGLTNYNFLSSPTDANLYINRPAANDIVFRAGNVTQAVLVGANGNFGIGTTTPFAKLSVDTSSLASGIAEFVVGSSTRTDFVITQSGFVGIGTPSPAFKLDVVGGIHGSGGLTLPSTSNQVVFGESSGISAEHVGIGFDGASQFGLGINDTNTTNTADFDTFYRLGSFIGGISENGPTAVAYNTTSDRRLKENIATSTDGLSTLLQIPIDNFNFINDPAKTKVQGFIAQDLERIYPEAVTTNGDNGSVALGSSTPWEVDYGRITPLIIKSVQDLNAIVDANASSSLHIIGDNGWTIATSTATGTVPIISISAPASSTPSVSINGTLYINGVDVGAGIASSTATTTPAALVQGPLAAATDAFKSAVTAALNSLQNIAQVGVRQLGAAVYATVGTFNNLFATNITATTVNTDKLCVNKSDGTPVCVTGDQLGTLLNGNASPAQAAVVTPPPSTPDNTATSTPEVIMPAVSADAGTTTVSDAATSTGQ